MCQPTLILTLWGRVRMIVKMTGQSETGRNRKTKLHSESWGKGQMISLFPGIETWAWFSSEKGIYFNGHRITLGDQSVLIDPPPMLREDRDRSSQQKIIAILLTNRDHVRDAMDWRIRLQVPIWAPAPDAMAMDFVILDETYKDGDRLPGGIQAIALADGKSAGESAFYLPLLGGIFILGDALIGLPEGALNLLPSEKYADIGKAAHGLRRLLDFPFEAVLVGDGASILTGGRLAVEQALERAQKKPHP